MAVTPTPQAPDGPFCFLGMGGGESRCGGWLSAWIVEIGDTWEGEIPPVAPSESNGEVVADAIV